MTTAPIPNLTAKIPAMLAQGAANQAAVNALAAPTLDATPMGTQAVPLSDPSQVPMPTLPQAFSSPLLTHQAKLNEMTQDGAGVDQIKNPLLRGIAKTGDIALSVFGAMSPLAHVLDVALPGTTAHHNLLVRQQEGLIANSQQQAQNDQQIQNDQALAEASKAIAMAGSDTPAPLGADDAAAIGHPELQGLMMSPRDRQKYFSNLNTNDTRSDNNAASNTSREAIAQAKLDALQAKPKQRDDEFIAITSKPQEEWTPDDAAFVKAYQSWVKTTKTDPGVARAVAGANARPLQVVLPGGQAGYMQAGQAEKSGAQGLGDNTYKAEGAALKDFTSGSDSHTLTAFNTAKGHLQQLAIAGDALQNGDIQGLNRLANSYGVATGQSAPVVFQGVKTAVSGEIAKAFTGAGATVDEINQIRQSINDANSPSELHDVVASYSHLLDTKSAALRSQFDAAKKGQANFGGNGNGNAPKVGDTKTFPNGKQGTWDGTGWVAH
jgi:hypothetical protein